MDLVVGEVVDWGLLSALFLGDLGKESENGDGKGTSSSLSCQLRSVAPFLASDASPYRYRPKEIHRNGKWKKRTIIKKTPIPENDIPFQRHIYLPLTRERVG